MQNGQEVHPSKRQRCLSDRISITEKAHVAEMESRMAEIKMNLFNPTRKYLKGNLPLEEKILSESSERGTKSKEVCTTSPTSSRPDVG